VLYWGVALLVVVAVLGAGWLRKKRAQVAAA